MISLNLMRPHDSYEILEMLNLAKLKIGRALDIEAAARGLFTTGTSEASFAKNTMLSNPRYQHPTEIQSVFELDWML
jgi:hypothetical protein